MGVGGAALLYSCTPAIGTAIGGFPGFSFLGNPFYRGPMAGANCGPDVPGSPQCATGTSSSSSTSGGSSSYRSGSSFSSTSGSSHSSGATAGQSTSQRGGFGSTASSHSSGSSSS